MSPDDPPKNSPTPLDYETPLPSVWRTVTIPRWLYRIHRALLEDVEVLSVVYGVLVLTIGWVFKTAGITFVIALTTPKA